MFSLGLEVPPLWWGTWWMGVAGFAGPQHCPVACGHKEL